MRIPGTHRVLPVAFAVLASMVGGRGLASAAADVTPPTLTCVDGVLTGITPRPGERVRFRRRWFCDVDGQANGVCTFGRRCRVSSECPIPSTRCHVTAPVPVGGQQREGSVILACLSSGTPTPCGPDLSCDSASQICVRREQGGPGVIYACEPVPAGCEADRSCGCAGTSLCQPFPCQDEGANSIACVCPACV